MIKADYSTIAHYYDAGTGLSEANLRLWLDLISSHAPGGEPLRLLDLGCGTGRFTLPIARHLRYSTVGVDASQEMLDRARTKQGSERVEWSCMDAADLRFDDATFDIVFMSHLLHHVDDAGAVLRECYRVTRPGGVVLVRYGSMDQIREDPVHTCFPEAMEIDLPRTRSVSETEQFARDAGYSRVSSQEIIQRTYETGADCLAAARTKSISVLTLMSATSFDTGIARLEERVNENPSDPWLLHTLLTLTCGYKD